MYNPDIHTFGRVAVAVIIDEIDVRSTISDSRGTREETHGFFENGVSVGKLVEKMWLL